ncbi:MAG TPA: hypothetical protein VFG04_11790 [Planctomycetaceae bacterium]|nr:hypothetical protein [Planctomycetaceae bacterium]
MIRLDRLRFVAHAVILPADSEGLRQIWGTSVTAPHEPYDAQPQEANAHDKAHGSDYHCFPGAFVLTSEKSNEQKKGAAEEENDSKYNSLPRSLPHAPLVSSTLVSDDLDRILSCHALVMEHS